MTVEKNFMRPDGTPIEWMFTRDTDELEIIPDHFSALRLLMAFDDRDIGTLHELLRERPALPLLSGVASLALGFARRLAGENMRAGLDILALRDDLDPLGAADEYRARLCHPAGRGGDR